MSNLNLNEIEHGADVALEAVPSSVRKQVYAYSKYVAVLLGVVAAVLTPLGDFTVYGFHLINALPYVLLASGLVHYLAEKNVTTPSPAPTSDAAPSDPTAPAAK